MLIQTCIRCSKGFDQSNNHPLSHFSTICNECKSQSPETIYDQNLYNIKLHQKLMDNKQ